MMIVLEIMPCYDPIGINRRSTHGKKRAGSTNGEFSKKPGFSRFESTPFPGP
jgi:hypothetical protein